MENLDEIGAQSSSSNNSGMESPTELVSSTIHGFPEVKTEQPQQQAVFVLAPQPPVQQQQPQQQPQADLYALTLSDGSVVHFKIENNAANATEENAAEVWQQQQPTVSGATSPAPLGAEVTLPFSAPSQTQLSSVTCPPQSVAPPPPPPPIMLSHHPQQQELHQALLSIDAAPPSPHHQVSQNHPSTWYG